MRAGIAAVEVLCATELTPLDVPGHPDLLGGVVPGPRLRDWLVRRKDAKLLPRAARLALPVAGRAVAGFEGDRESLGLFVGVRREPPDEGEADAAIVASARDGHLDVGLLAGRGRDLYPPLLPLKTLPNMVLAHLSINLGVLGVADTCTGGAAAGVSALRMAIHAVVEGRCPEALAVAADSHVDGGGVRDMRRLRVDVAPGEAAVAFRVVPAGQGLFDVVDRGSGLRADRPTYAHHATAGWCGCADGLLAMAHGGHAVGRDPDGVVARVERAGV